MCTVYLELDSCVITIRIYRDRREESIRGKGQKEQPPQKNTFTVGAEKTGTGFYRNGHDSTARNNNFINADGSEILDCLNNSDISS